MPVYLDNVIMDGGHRVAACLALNKPLKIVYINRNKIHKYDYNFFLNAGLNRKYLDYIIYEYVKLKSSSTVFCIWPTVSSSDYPKIEKIFEKHGKILYKKDLFLNKQGAINFVSQVYLNHSWVGSWKNNYSGIKNQYNNCFCGKGKLRIYFFESDFPKNSKNAKKEIRNFLKIGNYSVHSTDNHKEAIFLSKLVLNKNTINFMNFGIPHKFKKFNILFDFYLSKIPLDILDSYCIDSSAVLSVFGLRDCNDLDYICFNKNFDFKNSFIRNHKDNVHFYKINERELIFNPDNYFFYKGAKFVSLDNIIKMKKNRNELKDKNDIKLINYKFKNILDPTISFFYFITEFKLFIINYNYVLVNKFILIKEKLHRFKNRKNKLLFIRKYIIEKLK